VKLINDLKAGFELFYKFNNTIHNFDKNLLQEKKHLIKQIKNKKGKNPF